MKKIFFYFLVFSLPIFSFAQNIDFSQSDSTHTNIPKKPQIITTNDGGVFVGIITDMNDREITIVTQDKGKIIIPKYAIKKIEPVTSENYKSGKMITENGFATKYIIANSALPMEKNRTYINDIDVFIWSINYTFTENFSIGASGAFYLPLLLNSNLNFKIGDKSYMGMDIHFGSVWVEPIYFGNAILKYSYGTNEKNFTVGAGIIGGIDNSNRGYNNNPASYDYAYTFYAAAMTRINNALGLTGEFWIIPVPNNKNNKNFYLGGIGFKTLKSQRHSFTFALMPIIFPYTKYSYYPNHNTTSTYSAYPIPVITFTEKL